MCWCAIKKLHTHPCELSQTSSSSTEPFTNITANCLRFRDFGHVFLHCCYCWEVVVRCDMVHVCSLRHASIASMTSTFSLHRAVVAAVSAIMSTAWTLIVEKNIFSINKNRVKRAVRMTVVNSWIYIVLYCIYKFFISKALGHGPCVVSPAIHTWIIPAFTVVMISVVKHYKQHIIE